MTKFIPLIAALLFSAFSMASFAEDGEIVLKSSILAQATPERASAMPQRADKSRLKRGPTIQQMMRKLQPKKMGRATTAVGTANTVKGPNDPQGYEVIDCTGNDGVPMACCSYGGSGSTCDVFMALCDQMEGTTSSGNSNGAACKGDGVLE